MHPREKLLGKAKLLQSRGEPIPLDMLAEADHWGLSLTEFDQPANTNQHQQEGANPNGETETDL